MTRKAFQAFILYIEIANFKAEGWKVQNAYLYVSYAYGPTPYRSSIYGVGEMYLFISAMVFGDTRYKMSKDIPLRFFCIPLFSARGRKLYFITFYEKTITYALGTSTLDVGSRSESRH